jgi:hypothetical protein
MRIGAQSTLVENSLQRKGGVAYDSEKAAKQVEVDVQKAQREQIEKKKLTIPQDIEFKLRQQQLLEKQQKTLQAPRNKSAQPSKQSNQIDNYVIKREVSDREGSDARTAAAPSNKSGLANALVNDELPQAKRAISAYELTATIEKRQEIEALVGFDGFA